MTSQSERKEGATGSGMSSEQMQLKVGMNKGKLGKGVRGGKGTWPGVQSQVIESVESGA
jgi:hypothetical protein